MVVVWREERELGALGTTRLVSRPRPRRVQLVDLNPSVCSPAVMEEPLESGVSTRFEMYDQLVEYQGTILSWKLEDVVDEEARQQRSGIMVKVEAIVSTIMVIVK